MYRRFLSLALAGAALTASAADGAIGFSLEVGVDGFFSPTVAMAKVTSVKPGSPAEQAGVKVGDSIVRIEDCAIPGCPGSKAKALMDKAPGEQLHLLVQRADKTTQPITILVGSR